MISKKVIKLLLVVIDVAYRELFSEKKKSHRETLVLCSSVMDLNYHRECVPRTLSHHHAQQTYKI